MLRVPLWKTSCVSLLVLPALFIGCTRRPAAVAPASLAMGPATLTLDQIGPLPKLPVPATRPADERPPLDAIMLFAQARAAAQDGRRDAAIELVVRAIAIDPSSYELYYELANLHRQGLGYQPLALRAFERAAQIDPDRLDAQLNIARQLLAKEDSAGALQRLLLAIQTSEYAAGNLASAEVDFLLAYTLREQGYDQAALDRFELLIRRLARGDIERSDEVAMILGTRLFMQVGDLYLKREQPLRALQAYQTAEGTHRETSDLDVQSRIVRAMMLAGQVQQGVARAADVVRQFGASPASLALLRDVYAATGRPEGVTAALADLHRQHPNDQPILFALCEVLSVDGRTQDADAHLAAAWQRAPGNAALLVRWFRLRFDQDAQGAVRLLTEMLAEHPELAGQLDPVWRRLLSPEGRQRLPIEQLASLHPAEARKAAHHYIVARVAHDWPRSTLSRQSLDAALTDVRPFAPAFMMRLDEVLDDERLARRSREAAAIELVTSAELKGDAGLADLLRGRVALFRNEPTEALACFRSAAVRNVASPEPRLNAARALIAKGETSAAVGAAWEVAHAFPNFEPAYALLDEHPDHADPAKVFAAWRAAQPIGEPMSPELSLQQAADQLARGRVDGAELLLSDVQRLMPAEPELLDLAQRIDQARSGGGTSVQQAATAGFAVRLEQLLGEGPKLGPAGLTEVVTRLAQLYVADQRSTDATRVLDFARSAIGAAEPDLLYRLAEAYRLAGSVGNAEQALAMVLEVDPSHAAAARTLSSLWADKGRHLEAAERLARDAARWRPLDPLYRGTIGWVLYRSGDLQAAKIELLSAISLGEDGDLAQNGDAALNHRSRKPDRVDPVLLDRAGDALYRLGDRQTAAALWERAQRRLGDADVAAAPEPDINTLRLTLPRKLQQHRTGQDVQVSAVVVGNDE